MSSAVSANPAEPPGSLASPSSSLASWVEYSAAFLAIWKSKWLGEHQDELPARQVPYRQRASSGPQRCRFSTSLVESMLELVRAESERIDARVLEPACGSGNFLIPVLLRKLATVEARYRIRNFIRLRTAAFCTAPHHATFTVIVALT